MVVHYGLDRFSNSEGLIDTVSKYSNVNFNIAHMARFDGKILDFVNDIENMFIDTSCLSGECVMAQDFNLTEVYDGYERREFDFSNPFSVLVEFIDRFPGSVLWGTDSPFTFLRDGDNIIYDSSYDFTQISVKRERK